MKTLVLNTDPVNPSKEAIERAAELIRRGELVAFPTETVYGLGANGLDERCTQRIYEAKERPSDNPLILHIADWSQLEELAENIPDEAYLLTRHFWPGALTIVLNKSDKVPSTVTGGKSTVAVRMPEHPVALALIRAAGVPLAAPSANLSGKPSPTTAQHVLEDLDGRIAAVVDGGSTRIGLESTVVDFTSAIPRVLRPGGVSVEEIRAFIPNIRVAESDEEGHSPGMRYRHYSPAAKLVLVEANAASADQAIEQIKMGKSVAWLGESAPKGAIHLLFPHDAAFYARFFFAALRDLDAQKVDVIFVEIIPTDGLGAAVMDRIRRAAGYDNASSSD